MSTEEPLKMSKTPVFGGSFYDSISGHALSACYLTRTQATGANANGYMRAVNHCFDLTDVRFPGSVGLTVGVGNILTESYALSANTALCHLL